MKWWRPSITFDSLIALCVKLRILKLWFENLCQFSKKNIEIILKKQKKEKYCLNWTNSKSKKNLITIPNYFKRYAIYCYNANYDAVERYVINFREFCRIQRIRSSAIYEFTRTTQIKEWYSNQGNINHSII